MALHFSANQFEKSFRSCRLQSWGTTEQNSKRPRTRIGSTVIIADVRGHLIPEKKKRESSRTDFRGTWDLPFPIAPHHINPTSRSKEGMKRLKTWGFKSPAGGGTSTSNCQSGPPATEPHQDPEHVSISAYISIPQDWDPTLRPEQSPAAAPDDREVIAAFKLSLPQNN